MARTIATCDAQGSFGGGLHGLMGGGPPHMRLLPPLRLSLTAGAARQKCFAAGLRCVLSVND